MVNLAVDAIKDKISGVAAATSKALTAGIASRAQGDSAIEAAIQAGVGFALGGVSGGIASGVLESLGRTELEKFVGGVALGIWAGLAQEPLVAACSGR